VLFLQHTAAGLDISSLIAEKANAPDVEGERLEIGLGIIAGRSVFLE
jgi:hypothetical protein